MPKRSPKRRQLLSTVPIVVVALVLSILALGFSWWWKQSLDNRGDATTYQPNFTATYRPRVLLIGWNPTDASGRSVVSEYYSNYITSLPPAEMQRAQPLRAYPPVENFVRAWGNEYKRSFGRISNNEIQFEVVGYRELTSFPSYPNGFTHTIETVKKCVFHLPDFDGAWCDLHKFSFDYAAWARTNNICQIANELAIDEIWMFTPPGLIAWENFMIGPKTPFHINGAPTTSATCHKNVIVVNPAFDTPKNFMHNVAHRVEQHLRFLYQNWNGAYKKNLMNRYIGFDRYATPDTQWGSLPTLLCGNGHVPPNGRFHYDYGNTAPVMIGCDSWGQLSTNEPAFTQINGCNAWGCTDDGWQEYWLNKLPRRAGVTPVTLASGRNTTVTNNWWEHLLDSERTISQVTSETDTTCTPQTFIDSFDQPFNTPSRYTVTGSGTVATASMLNVAVPASAPTAFSQIEGTQKLSGSFAASLFVQSFEATLANSTHRASQRFVIDDGNRVIAISFEKTQASQRIITQEFVRSTGATVWTRTVEVSPSVAATAFPMKLTITRNAANQVATSYQFRNAPTPVQLGTFATMTGPVALRSVTRANNTDASVSSSAKAVISRLAVVCASDPVIGNYGTTSIKESDAHRRAR